MTTPDVAKAPALFLRNATGLVKGWSAFDAFGYSFFSVNLVTLGMFYSLAIFAFVPDGSVLSALVLSGVTMTFLCIVYAGLIAVMPRAGGDYVWQTRIFDGVPGAVVAALVGGLTGYLAANAFALGDAIAIVAGIAGLVIGAVLGMRARRDRIRPVQHRVVVHPRVVGTDLRLHPQHRSAPAPGGDRRRE